MPWMPIPIRRNDTDPTRSGSASKTLDLDLNPRLNTDLIGSVDFESRRPKNLTALKSSLQDQKASSSMDVRNNVKENVFDANKKQLLTVP
jgi:hypothetical protein